MSGITISDLYEMQKKLDERIIREKGLEGKDLLPNTVLALQVEIAELANEWRGFKHWSKDQNPRRERMLEEYVDCLHFFLSIARQLDLPDDDMYVPDDELESETAVLFTELLHYVGMINEHLFLYKKPNDVSHRQRHFFRAALGLFYNLGEQRFGFTWDQIAAAYVAKNRVNHERQENGY